jgi:hypothetical protein
MNLTPGQQRLVFVVVVIVLVALGIFVISSRHSGGTPAAAPSASAGTAQSSPGGSATVSTPPTAVPAPAPVSTAGGAEIYQWLPFTAADLAAAAKTTTAFATDYATWSYTEDKAAYGAKLNGLVTAQYLTVLEGDYDTSGVAGPRTADKQVSAGSGTIDSITSFGSPGSLGSSSTSPVSITFLVTINQKVTSTQPAATLNGQYSVTVAESGSAWQVSNIELSSLGNQ